VTSFRGSTITANTFTYDNNWGNLFPANGLSVTFNANIGNYAFADSTRLASVTIGTGVTSIGSQAFVNCTNLTSITIPDNVTSIGGGAFVGCTGLTDITINTDKVTSFRGSTITANTFSSINNWGSLFPANGLSVTFNANIGNYAFADSTRLASVTIGTGVTSIGNSAFNFCSGLTSVTFEGTIDSGSFGSTAPFPGDLRAKYLAAEGGIGTYTTTAPVSSTSVWTKQP